MYKYTKNPNAKVFVAQPIHTNQASFMHICLSEKSKEWEWQTVSIVDSYTRLLYLFWKLKVNILCARARACLCVTEWVFSVVFAQCNGIQKVSYNAIFEGDTGFEECSSSTTYVQYGWTFCYELMSFYIWLVESCLMATSSRY